MADNELTDPGSSTLQVSRRDLIKGVIAAGAVSSASYLFRAPTLWAQASAPGAVERLVTLTVNGQQRRVDVMKQETLATTLRYKLGLTGTKIGCDRSECGCLHGADRRCAALLLLDPDAHGCAARISSPLKGWPAPMASCTRCSKASSTNKASSARSACRASSWRRWDI